MSQTRHFYLRLPHNNYPVACVAVHTYHHSLTSMEVCFAVATYNPADVGTIPFNKSKARNMAMGRLNSDRHSITFTVPTKRADREIGRMICQSITVGEWHHKHPHAIAAHTAASHWLQQFYAAPLPDTRECAYHNPSPIPHGLEDTPETEADAPTTPYVFSTEQQEDLAAQRMSEEEETLADTSINENDEEEMVTDIHINDEEWEKWDRIFSSGSGHTD